MIRRLGVCVAAAISLPVFAAGCGEADPIESMLTTLGGRDAIETLESLAVEAECNGPSGPFRTEVKSLRPGQVYFRQSSDRDTTIIWSTDDGTWLGDGRKSEPADARLESIARGHEFHLHLFDVDSRFSKHERAGDEQLDGHACARVNMIDSEGNPASLLVDKRSHRPRMLELNPPGAAGPVRVFFEDWRRVGDLLYFHSFLLTEGTERTFTYRYTSVMPNSVDANVFAAPAGPDTLRG